MSNCKVIDVKFNGELVSKIVKDAIERTIGHEVYEKQKVNTWTGRVVNKCLELLINDQTAFKYIVTAMVMQKDGGGLHTASGSYWNSNTDGSCTVRWENATMYCLVSVYGLSV